MALTLTTAFMSNIDSHTRSLAKAISYRVLGSVATFIVSYLVTGSTNMAVSLTAVDFFSKIILFWIHERVWTRIK